MRVLVLSIILGSLSMIACAQHEGPRIKYGGMQQLSFIVEATSVRPAPSMINGIRYGKWYAGIGVTYEISENLWRWGGTGVNTMPLFLDTRYYFFKKKWAFALADLGGNFIVGNPWMQNDDRTRHEKKVGYYGNLGLGVKARLGRETFYSFDVSYNFKQTRYNSEQRNGVNLWTEEFNNFKQRRILIRMGIEI